jgi:hypothetical protein
VNSHFESSKSSGVSKIWIKVFGPKPIQLELSLIIQKVLMKTKIVWVSFWGKKDTLHEIYGNLEG